MARAKTAATESSRTRVIPSRRSHPSCRTGAATVDSSNLAPLGATRHRAGRAGPATLLRAVTAELRVLDNTEVDAYIERIYDSLGNSYTEAELLEATRLAHLSLTQEQRERMLPELMRRQAVYRSVDFPSSDRPAARPQGRPAGRRWCDVGPGRRAGPGPDALIRLTWSIVPWNSNGAD
jgi:hypothetical protein